MSTHACPLCGLVHEIYVPPPPPPPPAPTNLFNAKLISGMTYDNVVFTGGTTTRGVLHIDYPLQNVVVKNFHVVAGPQNGISINAQDGVDVRNVVFDTGVIDSQPRMGLECTDRRSAAVYQMVQVLNTLFHSQGNEAVSFDSLYAGSCNCLFTDNVIEGAGQNIAQPYGNGFEINGPAGFEVARNHIYACRGAAFNLQRHSSADCLWNFHDNVLDSSHRVQSVLQSASAQQVLAQNVYGGKFPLNQIVSSAPGGSVAYLSGCHNMDWRTSTWKDASGRAGYATPNQPNCSGNQF